MQCCRVAAPSGISHHTEMSRGGILEVWSVEVAPGSVVDTATFSGGSTGALDRCLGPRNSC